MQQDPTPLKPERRAWHTRSYARLVIALAMASTAFAAPSVAAAQPLNTATGFSALNGVSCPTTAFCISIGYYAGPDQATHPLIERWNGKSWSIASSPLPAAADAPGLDFVACATPTACRAIGSNVGAGGGTFAEQWNGRQWRLQGFPSRRFDEVRGLSCGAPKSCTAIGINGDAQEVNWRLTGAGWKRSMPPNLKHTMLGAISCPTARSCFAAGKRSVIPERAGTAQIEHWDGTKWTAIPAKLPAGAWLGGISCPMPRSCTATGSIGSVDSASHPLKMLVVTDSGSTRWAPAVLSLPAGVNNASLHAVSCSSTRVCTANATYNLSVDASPGETYSVATRGPEGAFHLVRRSFKAELTSVSCHAGVCAVVGFAPVPDGRVNPLPSPGTSLVIDRGRGSNLVDSHPAVPRS